MNKKIVLMLVVAVSTGAFMQTAVAQEVDPAGAAAPG